MIKVLPIAGTDAMHHDVRDLRNFYYRRVLGRAAQNAMRDQVVQFWPEAKGQTVVGFGFAVPLLSPYLLQARRLIALMPGPQGVMPWPAGLPSVSVLGEETRWPLETGSVDKLLVLHGLETSEHPDQVLEESFRVLGPGGRALFVVPNRAGIWARRDKTPFGFGHPYSLSQLESRLRQHGFGPERHRAALFFPPTERRFWLRSAAFWERAGRRVSSYLAGGVLMVEACKQMRIPTRPGFSEAVRRPLRILDGVGPPVASSKTPLADGPD